MFADLEVKPEDYAGNGGQQVKAKKERYAFLRKSCVGTGLHHSQRMDFSEALFLMKAGRRVRRASWPEFFLYIWLEGGMFNMQDREDGWSTVPVNNEMVLAEDWQEVEGETK